MIWKCEPNPVSTSFFGHGVDYSSSSPKTSGYWGSIAVVYPGRVVWGKIVKGLWNFMQEKPLSSTLDEFFCRSLEDKHVEGNADNRGQASEVSERN